MQLKSIIDTAGLSGGLAAGEAAGVLATEVVDGLGAVALHLHAVYESHSIAH